jgi:hypothetical protein
LNIVVLAFCGTDWSSKQEIIFFTREVLVIRRITDLVKDRNRRRSQDSSVGMATRLRAGRPRSGVRFPEGTQDFSLEHPHIAWGPSTLIQWVPGADSSGVKRQGGGVENGGVIPPLLHTSSWRGAELRL